MKVSVQVLCAKCDNIVAVTTINIEKNGAYDLSLNIWGKGEKAKCPLCKK